MENRNCLHNFINYLDDEDVYDALEKYWIDMFFMLLHKENIYGNDWICPYYNTTFGNGKKMMDGNPIFSAKSIKKDEIIRIIQESPKNGNVFSYWINSSMGNNQSQKELVIVCTLNNYNLEKINDIIISWIKGNLKDTNYK
ncbi:hypothetical protein SAMN05661091_4916 [Paenibacillus uliginis N3/975]|uniref:Uncharacterized protein n=1 Tax=Paenibacillus uliginis N3/975 TaxID=1313296 RepID=A0A1X7HQ26_9BACL|nr:hypothetical protein [Paenibacillus uliginis]SMF90165.1 hypothetical protein SAMN05661091_4916 [Paenibacillus uliginis N3/975]